MSRSFRPISWIAVLSAVLSMSMVSACGETGGDQSYGPYFKASNAGRGDSFGASVAWFQDMLVIGAPGEDSDADGVDGDQGDDSAEDSGAVYVFQRSLGSDSREPQWMQVAYLKASNSGAGDRFGASVAVSGDLIAVGAWGESSAAVGVDGDQSDDSLPESGAVYLFERDSAGWKQVAYIKPTVSAAGNRFGSSVSLWGDMLVVGAPREDGASSGVDGDPSNCCISDSGAVYGFDPIGGGWLQTAYIKSPNPAPGNFFGHSVVTSEFMLAVGAPSSDGSVYLYDFTGRTWEATFRLEGFDSSVVDDFGASLSLWGRDRLAVGAPSWDGGAAYVFEREGAGWVVDGRVQAASVERDDAFGQSVAVAGGVLAVGAPGDDGGATGVGGDPEDSVSRNSGAVYMFRLQRSQWEPVGYIKAPNTEADDEFGVALAFDSSSLAVSAPGEDGGYLSSDVAGESGAVFVLDDVTDLLPPVTASVRENVDGGAEAAP